MLFAAAVAVVLVLITAALVVKTFYIRYESKYNSERSAFRCVILVLVVHVHTRVMYTCCAHVLCIRVMHTCCARVHFSTEVLADGGRRKC